MSCQAAKNPLEGGMTKETGVSTSIARTALRTVAVLVVLAALVAGVIFYFVVR